MAGGNVHGRTVGARTQRRPARLVPVGNGAPLTSLAAEGAVLSDQKTFGAANRWQVQDDSQMRSQPHASRMRVPLPIAEQQIRRLAQLS